MTYREAKSSSQYTKAEVGFESPAKGDNHCGICTHFLKDQRACEIVTGDIGPEDWCEKFARRKVNGKANHQRT